MAYYNEHIDMKINAKNLDATHKDSHYEDIRCMARNAEIEARFYSENRFRLIKMMMHQGLAPKYYKVHKFPIKALHDENQKADIICDI
ncbi:hypothetical protein TRIP_B350437 [uncultured Desulfatiglans sp.]|nr:hypothetical protein TRIP_B350437 [uncultured Desulfatiglans sp.]